MLKAYYNEIDPFASQWLVNLINAGHIMAGDVDTRSIVEVKADDLKGYVRCHFFAGIAGWDLALRWAGWPDAREVWTGSCPCQPLSVAGLRQGDLDERHLWPAFHRLIAERRPAAIFGEQVASKDGREWASAVRADLEGDGYAVGIADLGAASVGAPHIRQRLWWVGHAEGRGRREFGDAGVEGRGGYPDGADVSRGLDNADGQRPAGRDGAERSQRGSRARRRAGGMGDAGSHGDRQHPRELSGDEGQHEVRPADGGHASQRAGAIGELADADRDEQRRGRGARREGGARAEGLHDAGGHGSAGGVADTADADRRSGERGAETGIGQGGLRGQRSGGGGRARLLGKPAGAGLEGVEDRRGDVRGAARAAAERAGGEPAGPLGGERGGPGTSHGGWANADWLRCRDGRWRPVEPGTFPLATGLPARLGRLRGYGNAIPPQVAAEVIAAFMECRP